MPMEWNINDIEGAFSRPRERIELIYGETVENYQIEATAPLLMPVQFGVIAASGNSGWKYDDAVKNFFMPAKGVLYHWLPMLDTFLKVYFRYHNEPQLGSYKNPADSYFDYTMGTQMSTFDEVALHTGTELYKFLMPPTLQMFSMKDRMPDIYFENVDPVSARTLTMFMLGRKYKLREISRDELEKSHYKTYEFGIKTT